MYESIESIINPKAQDIQVVKAKTGNERHEGYSELIGCRMFCFVRLYDNGDGVFIDDEGLYAEEQNFWIHRNYPHPLANIGVFVGIDEEGTTVPPKTPLPVLKKDVAFVGDHHDLSFLIKVYENKISNKDGYDDYRPLFFPELQPV